jgi:N-acetylmuramoyl-L-alanine amidase
MNRTESEEFPDTVKEVIFDRRYGTQFSPVDDGSIYLTPSEESVLAAKMCLDGYRTDPDILFFYNPSISESTYFRENRTYAFTVGSHEFFS